MLFQRAPYHFLQSSCMQNTCLALLTIAMRGFPFSGKAQTTSARLTAIITVDLRKETGAMDPVWAWFGHDEPNYTYMKDGRKLLSALAALSPALVYMRTHNLLTSGNGVPALKWGSTNAYSEDAKGNPVYNWAIIDSIFDAYIARGMKPLAEIGFMPEALSTKSQPYQEIFTAPQLLSGINWAAVRYQSVNGWIVAKWERVSHGGVKCRSPYQPIQRRRWYYRQTMLQV